MRRSQVNAQIEDALDLFAAFRVALPPFAHWSPGEWRAQGERVQELVRRGLGWDLTDFGLGDYDRAGLLLVTLRNGRLADLSAGAGEVYAEKLLVCGVGQLTPRHFHHRKTEDIINRGGGVLVLELHWADDQGGLSAREVRVRCDGVERHLPPGGHVRLAPGESITLSPRLYHAFWAEEERVLAGEVSTVNDDAADNHFLDPVGRFPTIEEDAPPVRLLVSDYGWALSSGRPG